MVAPEGAVVERTAVSLFLVARPGQKAARPRWSGASETSGDADVLEEDRGENTDDDHTGQHTRGDEVVLRIGAERDHRRALVQALTLDFDQAAVAQPEPQRRQMLDAATRRFARALGLSGRDIQLALFPEAAQAQMQMQARRQATLT